MCTDKSAYYTRVHGGIDGGKSGSAPIDSKEHIAIFSGEAAAVAGYCLYKRDDAMRSNYSAASFTESQEDAMSWVDQGKGFHARLVKLWKLADGKLLLTDPGKVTMPVAPLYAPAPPTPGPMACVEVVLTADQETAVASGKKNYGMPWTTALDQQLRDMARYLTVDQLMEHFGRTSASIICRLERLGTAARDQVQP